MADDEEPDPEIVGQASMHFVVDGSNAQDRQAMKALRARGLMFYPWTPWWPPGYIRHTSAIVEFMIEQGGRPEGRSHPVVLPLPPRRPHWWRRWAAQAIRRRYATATELRLDVGSSHSEWVVEFWLPEAR